MCHFAVVCVILGLDLATFWMQLPLPLSSQAGGHDQCPVRFYEDQVPSSSFESGCGKYHLCNYIHKFEESSA
jgi:hypothetical protein